MLLLITYVLVALVFSFLCSIAEAVMLSVTMPHIVLMEQEQKASGVILRRLKTEVGRPLAAILTLNTIAHTVGAAGAGAQATVFFGDAYVGIASAVLTLLILVFSEIIPKTIGARYWRELAPITAHGLRLLIYLLYPFVKMSELLTGSLTHGPTLNGFSRSEFAAMADLSTREGQLARQEAIILKNLLLMRETQVKDAMTPRTVVFSLPESMHVEEFFHQHDNSPFSRIPVYSNQPDQISGFVLRSDLLLAQARGNSANLLKSYIRPITLVHDTLSLFLAFDKFMKLRTHILLIIDEYGGMKGVLTLEDVLETLLGLEIVDERDKTVDMQQLARKLWEKRAKEMGLDISE
jgi:CBS domain containing-hemolysin-like protein